MKVILFTPEYPPRCGGVGYYVYYLSRALRELGIEPHVIIRGKKDRFFTEDHIPIYEVRCPGVAPLNYPFIKRRITTLLEELGGDLLHIHSSTMPWIETTLPVIVTAHSSAIESTLRFHRPVKDLHALYRNLLLPLYRQVEGTLVRRCNLLTVVSHSMRREFYQWYQIDSEIVGNAVDLIKFNSGKAKKNYVLYVGMFTIGKGILDLVEAAPAIARNFPGHAINMIGSGSLAGYLNRKIRKNGIKNLQIINHLPHSQLIKYYQEAGLFVLPSYYEGLPTTILEAMACGLPVVATDVGGIPDQVEEGVTGYLVPPGRPDLLAERMCRLLADASLRGEMGRRGRLKVEKEFSWQHVAEKFIMLYTHCLA
jgi:L-malate glycosyltransferase